MSVDLAVDVGEVALPSPVMTASGTAGHGTELAAYVDLGSIGAVVVKSLSATEWQGNPAPRVHETAAGMLNSVGLSGPGVAAWRRDQLPGLLATGARVVVSIWGTSVQGYRAAAEALAGLPDGVVAVEVNLSCPNVEERRKVFAHDPTTAAQVMRVVDAVGLGRPLWAKLSPNVTDLVAIAAAVREAGADAVTLVNTVMGLLLDPETRRPALGGGGGGLSGRAVHPVAVRSVWDVYAAMPDLPIVGVGGVATGWDAVELLLAGARAVQVGTATFADPRAVRRVQEDVARWCEDHDVFRVAELTGGAHD